MSEISPTTRIIDLTVEQFRNIMRESQVIIQPATQADVYRMNRTQVAEIFGISLSQLSNLQSQEIVRFYYEKGINRPYFLSNEVNEDYMKYKPLMRKKKALE